MVERFTSAGIAPERISCEKDTYRFRLPGPPSELLERFMQYLSEQWVPGTDQLHRAVTERRLTHPDDPALNRHVEGSMMRDTRRGLRIDKRPGHNNDGLVALLMAVARMEVKQPAGARLLGWI